MLFCTSPISSLTIATFEAPLTSMPPPEKSVMASPWNELPDADDVHVEADDALPGARTVDLDQGAGRRSLAAWCRRSSPAG